MLIDSIKQPNFLTGFKEFRLAETGLFPHISFKIVCAFLLLNYSNRSRGGLVARSQLGGGRDPDSKPDSTEMRRVGTLHVKSDFMGRKSSQWCGAAQPTPTLSTLLGLRQKRAGGGENESAPRRGRQSENTR
ncbi:hypothetical protein AVEN_82979-1 [Araneus ventricosus]|uniref:Uncharacterized protein n=1 Tax=Araneus ventricosus TaxID=182803 RepID=A0A4Y2U2W7_ARAVE|nr:hypothetical protein AVEN_266542-1 [Araneus ventricosus]GBO07355.1 hypothetical protein AVEN_82979-1 [Araneus ventricosus]